MKMLEKGLGGKMDMSAFGKMTKQNAMKERLRNKMQMKQMQQQMNAIESKTVEQQKSFVVKIGDEVQEKSGLRPNALSEEELIKLFGKDKKSKKESKDKKTKTKK